MWKKIKLKNFRLFEDPDALELAPVTILIGPNNGGKSTLIKSLLLLKQSAEVEDLQIPIVPNGGRCELGSYSDYIFKGETERKLGVEIEWDNFPNHQGEFYRAGLRVEWGYDQHQSTVFVDEVEFFSNNESVISAKKSNGAYHISSSQLNSTGDGTISLGSIQKFYRISASLFNSLNMRGLIDLTARLNFLEGELRRRLEATMFLSSLRYPPKKVYSLPEDRPSEVGRWGERAVDIIAVNPELAEKIDGWVQRLELAEGLKIRPLNAKYFSLELQNFLGMPINLINVGFGAPQLLPVLVAGLHAPPLSTIILEQPEIHINPSIQARLMDYILTLSRYEKKQFIIETHSEHLLNRVRTWIAREEIKNSDVAIYYVYPDREQGKGMVKRLEIDDYGKFENWPRGFFEEEFFEAHEQMRLVSERKKKAREAN